MRAALLGLAFGILASASNADETATGKLDLRGLRLGMVKSDVLDVQEDPDACDYRAPVTKSQPSGITCGDIDVEFTSQLTGAQAWLITYSFCSTHDQWAIADDITVQYGRQRQGAYWMLEDGTRVWFEGADLAQCPSFEHGWEIHLESRVKLNADRRARLEYEDPHPAPDTGPVF